jgi:UDP-2-acetamido-2,6-beta-L-arabino-hexul-4-ose reductase
MVIGNGLIAKAFSKYESNDKVVIFASGVSNSKETDESQYKREEILLKDTLLKFNNQIFVYFSTTSIYDNELKNSRYCSHKLLMENIVKNLSTKYYIFRLSEVVGKSKNKYQIVNYFYNVIKNQETFTLWQNACRRLIDVEDVYLLCNTLLTNKKYINNIYNITTPYKIKVTDIVTILEKILNIKSKAIIENKGNCYDIKGNCIYNILKDNLEFKYIWEKEYAEQILVKYFVKKRK